MAPARYGGGGRMALWTLVRMCVLVHAAPVRPWWRRTAVTLFDAAPDPTPSPQDPSLWIYLTVAVILVLGGGAFAGLTIALMGQDETYLQVMASSGEANERKSAARVLALLKKGKHWVLVTLLLSNVITNETLPIVLDRSLGGGWPAVLSSTVLIVIFGEIVPQSVCVRYGLSIGAFMAPFVQLLMYLLCPVAWPTAKLLDWLLGEDKGTLYKKAGLKTLVQLHKTLGTTPAERLMEDEVTIINSVLDLKEKPVGNIMTPMQDVFTISADTVLDERMMETILSQGYSRIPVHAPDNYRNFIGMLLVKMLITYDPEDCKRVRDFSLATLPETYPYTSCLDIINFFQEGKSHMVLVSDFPGTDRGALGVVTLEDVIEELIGEEIIDESDVFVDVHKAIRRLQPAPRQKFRPPIAEPAAGEADAKELADDVPLLGKDEVKYPNLPNGQQPSSGTTLMMRRKSSVGSDATGDTLKPVPTRTNAIDLKQHLKHLGPSNAANKPRLTKYASVKIKPGVGTIPEGQATATGMQTRPKLQPDEAVSENTFLLRASAAPPASGGVEAVKAGYGTTFLPASNPRLSGDSNQISASEASRLARENASPPPPPADAEAGDDRPSRFDELKFPDDRVVEEADDRVGELEAPSRNHSKPRRTARSGSITETEVDAGGMKKVVLGTSSSEELEDTSPVNGREEWLEDNADGDGQDDSRQRRKRGKRKKGNGGDESHR